MQFHHHGYVSEDPRVLPADGVGLNPPKELPEKVDVLIVGSGPAGMMTAAQLAMFPSATTAVIERRDGRLKIGHADGVQARSVETFEAFNFAKKITEEAYRITETRFWKPDTDNPENIIRASITDDDPTGISEFPHLIVNQARVLDCLREFMANSPSRTSPFWGWEFLELTVGEGEYPVEVKVRGTAGEQEGTERTIHAKYVLGADGAHSKVRKDIGAEHIGKPSYHAWGVMDILVNTDFPDIRTKCIIHSKAGAILHIPREGGYLFRSYVDLGEVPEDDNGEVRKTPLEEIIKKCNEILHPYSIDVKEVAWWSVYEVGHRVTDRFDDVLVEEAGKKQPHVFIAGDACHTHSAKAGQGMNVSMQDGFNLAWKLGYVLSGRSDPSLLATYSAERQVIAQDLIDFDSDWARRMAAAPGEDAEAIEDFYVKTAEFPAGFMTEYPPSLLIGEGKQELASKVPLGKRFKSAPVVRVCDATAQHLGHLHKADGRFRIYAFADGEQGSCPKLDEWAQWMATSPDSPVNRHTPKNADIDSIFDIKVIYPMAHRDCDVTKAPEIFRPASGPLGLIDLNKMFATDVDDPIQGFAGDIFEMRGIDKGGAVIVVRPDMYVSHILSFDDTAELGEYFAGFLKDA